jgi:hypothetical protein
LQWPGGRGTVTKPLLIRGNASGSVGM